MSSSRSFLASFVLLSSLAVAQSPVYGQCGGQGWSGSTTCVSGSTCTYSNPYYSQCLPGSGSTTTVKTTTTTTTPTTVSSSSSSPTSTGSSSVNYWFSFGDSYTTTGFTVSGTQPSVGNPLGNPAYPGYTGGGGVNYVDLVTTQNNKSTLLTYNLAYGGATIDANLVQPYQSTVLSLTDQVNEFLNSYATSGNPKWTSTNSLFSVWIGINDIGNSYYNGGGSAFNTKLMNAYFALVQKLYNAGARNFMFINVPPIDRSPLMLSQSSSSQAMEKTTIADFNSQLASAITKFKSSNSGVTTYTWDSNAYFTTVLNDPKAYGFVDATSYGNTGDFWGNNYHPSAAAHTLFAQQVGNNVLGATKW